jgi:putative membrane-bound dehydrogenase-like protein
MFLAPRYPVFRLLLTLLLSLGFIASLQQPAPVDAQEKTSAWKDVRVPEIWRVPSPGSLGNNLGFAWYRCLVDIPADWRGKTLQLYLESIDDAREVYINGVKVAALGVFPPKYRSGLGSDERYSIKPQLVLPGQTNVLAIRVYFNLGRARFNVAAPLLVNGEQAITTAGTWQYQPGDNTQWALWKERNPKTKAFGKVSDTQVMLRELKKLAGDKGPRTPKEAVKLFKVAKDLQVQQVLADPHVTQPLSLKFDHRGRLWVIEYRQYPTPAGLKMLGRDKYLRSVYDKVPEPPPHHFPGIDRVSIHEDTDGDGIYDTHKNFLEGLSLVTSVALGRGGVWALNPPYLLFYPDRNQDDVPDGDPEVHLEGFGMEDSHSVTNSLRWGPDGWLYASQGSTVSGRVKRYGSKDKPVHSVGQLIWRYHPQQRKYEIFAEGGGNSFGVEFDAHGRVYSGHNGGNTRGFHYVQGGYFQKSFAKHGQLSNPYAYGFFPYMTHHQVPRFTHTFVINEGGVLPKHYQRKLFGVSPLSSHVVYSEVSTEGSSFQTKDLGHPLQGTDNWFRPVDIKMGPDGAIYVADLYEQRIDHGAHYQGRVDKTNGRVYRLHGKNHPVTEKFDLSKLSSQQLIKVLENPNKWYRQTALRLFGDRRDQSVIAPLRSLVQEESGLLALNALWALNLSGGLDEDFAAIALRHKDPYVRSWTTRLMCDNHQVSANLGRQLAELAKEEPHVEVRSQLACSARRLPLNSSLAITQQLLTHSQDASDIHMPLLLWWAIETHVEADPVAVVKLFEDKSLWELTLVQEHILERLMRRLASSGRQKDLVSSASLLQLAPNSSSQATLMKGFEKAFQGRSLADLPPQLIEAIANAGGGSLELRLRQSQPTAITEALKKIAEPKTATAERVALVEIFGQVQQENALPVLLTLVGKEANDDVVSAALISLISYDDAKIPVTVLGRYDKFSSRAKPVAQSLLVSRLPWTQTWLQQVASGKIAKDSIPLALVRRMLLHNDPQIKKIIEQQWGSVSGATTAQMKQQIATYQQMLQTGSGHPAHGKKLFLQHCGKCHVLFSQGGKVGPDLTSYKRDDLGNMLLNVVNPSIEIRKGFETYAIFTEDGRTLNGFIEDQDDRVVVLRGIDGQRIVVAKDQIDEMAAVPRSIMPENILKPLSDQQIRDLFSYLRASQPLP